MKRMKRAISLVLIFTLLCGVFAACGGGDGEKKPGASPAANGGNTDGKVWVPTFYGLPEEIGYFNTANIAGDAIYVGTTAVVNETDKGTDGLSGGETSVPVIYKISTDGKTFEKLPNYAPPAVPAGSEGSANVNSLSIDPEGNLWVAENVYAYHYELPEGYSGGEEGKYEYYKDDGRFNYLRRLDPTGTELGSVDLTELAAGAEYFSIQDMTCDQDGNVYLNLYTDDGKTKVCVYDPTGVQLVLIEKDDWTNGMVTLSDGSVAVCGYSQNGSGYELTPIDLKAKAWGKAVQIGTDMYSGVSEVFTGSGEYLAYFSSGSNVYGHNAETGEDVKLFTFLDCNIDQDYVRDMTVLPDGSFLCISYSWEDEAGEAVVITQKDASEVAQKTTLTLATMYLDYDLRKQILKFNKTSEQYRIEVKDYSEFNTEEDYTAGLTKMNTEIISGTVPDLISVSELPVGQYVSHGLLENLYPYIDSDAELSREDFLPSILKAMEIDGGLYQASTSFSVLTLVGRADVVGEDMGWTMEELMEIYEQQPDGTLLLGNTVTQEEILYYLTCMNLSQFVDWQTGVCSFDSEAFINTLKFCDHFPKEYNYEEAVSEVESITSGKQMLSMFATSDFEEFQMYEAMYGGALAYKGFPTNEGIGNVASLQDGVAITTKCADKEGAWSFVRTLLTEEYQSSNNVYSFPTNKTAFDKKLAEAMKKTYTTDPVTGEQVEESKGSWGWDSFVTEIYAVTQEQADRIVALIDSVSSVVNFDENILDVVKEEAASYFSGAKSAEEVAKLIQSRVNIYVNEQK